MVTVSTALRITLVIMNIILFLAFLTVTIVGFFLKFNKTYVKYLMSSLSEKWPSNLADEVAVYIQLCGSVLAMGLIVFGFIAALAALFGLIAVFWKSKFAAAIYITLLSALTVAELAFLVYIAYPGNLHKVADKTVNQSIRHIVEAYRLSPMALVFWNIVGYDNSIPCCGMNGIADFEGIGWRVPLPSTCCGFKPYKRSDDTYDPPACDYQPAILLRNVIGGCKDKIYAAADKQKALLVAVPACLASFQLLGLIVMGAFCTRWGNDDY